MSSDYEQYSQAADFDIVIRGPSDPLTQNLAYRAYLSIACTLSGKREKDIYTTNPPSCIHIDSDNLGDLKAFTKVLESTKKDKIDVPILLLRDQMHWTALCLSYNSLIYYNSYKMVDQGPEDKDLLPDHKVFLALKSFAVVNDIRFLNFSADIQEGGNCGYSAALGMAQAIIKKDLIGGLKKYSEEKITEQKSSNDLLHEGYEIMSSMLFGAEYNVAYTYQDFQNLVSTIGKLGGDVM